jgi:hypothetical protein
MAAYAVLLSAANFVVLRIVAMSIEATLADANLALDAT